MGYYENLHKVNIEIQKYINQLLSGSIESIDIDFLVLDLTMKFAVSDKAIRNRINLICSKYPENLKLVNNEVISLCQKI